MAFYLRIFLGEHANDDSDSIYEARGPFEDMIGNKGFYADNTYFDNCDKGAVYEFLFEDGMDVDKFKQLMKKAGKSRAFKEILHTLDSSKWEIVEE